MYLTLGIPILEEASTLPSPEVKNYDCFISGAAVNNGELHSRIEDLFCLLTTRSKKSQVFDCLSLCL